MNPYLFSRIRGPVFLLVFGLTALLAQQHILSFAHSWPLYLIAGGLLRIGSFFWQVPQAVAGYPGAPIYPWRRHRCLTTGFLLLGIGVVALLLTTGVISSDLFWPVYGRWWPLLLILIGCLLLLDRTIDRRGPVTAGGVPVGWYPHRSHGIGWIVALLILLGLFGHTSHSLWKAHNDWDPDTWFQFGNVHNNDLTLNAAMTATNGGTLVVVNPRGEIQIAASDDNQIHLQAHQSVHAGSDTDAEKSFRNARPVLDVHGASATVRIPEGNKVSTALVITAPPALFATLTNANGDITITGLHGGLNLTQNHGGVTLSQIDGPVHLSMDHGDVSARDLGSELVVSGRVDDVSLSGIKGRASLNGDFFGDTTVSGTGAGLSFHSSRTQIDASSLSGELSLDSGDLTLSGVSGGLKIVTRSKDLNVSRVSGEAEIADTDGDVAMSAIDPLGTIGIVNRNGDVALTLPASASFSIEGQVGDDSDIDSDFSINPTQTGSLKTFHAQIGQGGPHIRLQADHGDINIKKGSSGSSVTDTGKSIRHLRTSSTPPEPKMQ